MIKCLWVTAYDREAAAGTTSINDVKAVFFFRVAFGILFIRFLGAATYYCRSPDGLFQLALFLYAIQKLKGDSLVA